MTMLQVILYSAIIDMTYQPVNQSSQIEIYAQKLSINESISSHIDEERLNKYKLDKNENLNSILCYGNQAHQRLFSKKI